MAWRGLHISRPASLRLSQRRLEIEQENGTLQFPLEDLAWVVLDTPQVSATAALLAALTEAGVIVVVGDAKHLPCGLLLPFHQHFRQSEVAHRQLRASTPLKKQLWRAIVRAKIANQAAALELVGADGVKTLSAMIRHVRSGDPENVEARAGRYYWARLFEDFRRRDGSDKRNALLNYGYAILRAAIARSLVAYGLLPAFGLHHHSVQNAFNLADDLIEPYRPFVDVLGHRLSGADNNLYRRAELVAADRQAMATVLCAEAIVEREQVAILTAIDRTSASLARVFASGRVRDLLLPGLVQ